MQRPPHRARCQTGSTLEPDPAETLRSRTRRRTVKLAVVVQRYGEAINGGAELHARYIAEHLARHAQVEVLTTCALDYVTWRNELPAGVEQVNGLTVRRFKVDISANPLAFGRWSRACLRAPHSLADELAWLDAEGPASPALDAVHRPPPATRTITSSSSATGTITRITALGRLPARAVLVPTAERDPAVGLAMFRPLFGGVRALMYNSPEERAMIQAVAESGGSVGRGRDWFGSARPHATRPLPAEVRHPRSVCRLCRPDRREQGVQGALRVLSGLSPGNAGNLSLVLIGNSILPIPDHPRIRHLGFVDDRDKFDGDGRRRAPGHAVVLREPLDGRARGLGAWPAGAGQRRDATC